MNNDIYNTAIWCNEATDKVKGLQDICLDHIDDPDMIDTIKRLSAIQKEIEILAKECNNYL